MLSESLVGTMIYALKHTLGKHVITQRNDGLLY